MTFKQSVATCFQKFLTFSGRARRSEFWHFQVFAQIVTQVSRLLNDVLLGRDAPIPLGYFTWAAIILPLLAVGWRRFHDVGLPGWPSVVWYVAIYSVIFLSLPREIDQILIVIGVLAVVATAIVAALPSQRGENRYGSEIAGE